MNASKARLCDIVQETGAKTIHYLYDFGDSWDHVIKLEKWFDNTTTEGLPLLLEAAGRCPPEDVGGAPGYADYLDAVGDPTHPEHEQMRLWGPERFDPNGQQLGACECSAAGCDAAQGGLPPGFIVVSLADGYPVRPLFWGFTAELFPLRPSVRVPYGGT